VTSRLACLAALLLLAGCEASPHAGRPLAAEPQPLPVTSPAVAAAGGAGACGGTAETVSVTADRGIGGTGVGGGTGDTTLADRGIGGTGVGSGLGGIGPLQPGAVRGLQSAERGGGGTGIVGVITGLSELCVDGVAVAVDRPLRLEADGSDSAAVTLALGDVAAVQATGPSGNLRAISIGIRHEVSGQISAVAASGESIEIAGQHVLLSPHTRVAAALHAGAWVVVSGLRDPTGTIRASRVDAREPGEVVVAGVPVEVAGTWQIGGLRLRLPPKLVPGPERLSVAGDYADGVLRAHGVSLDPLVPAGGALRTLFVEGYPTVEGHEVRLANGLQADVGPAFGATPPTDQPIILELLSTPDGSLTAVSWHEVRANPSGAGHSKVAPDTAPAAPDPAVPTSPTSLLQSPAPPASTTTAASAATPATTSTTSATTAAATTTTSSTSATSGSSSDTTSQSNSAPGNGGGNSNGPASMNGVSAGVNGGSTGSASPAPAPPPSPAPAAPSARTPPATIGEGHKSLPGAPGAPSSGAGAEGGTDGPPAPGISGGNIGSGGTTTGKSTGPGSGTGTGVGGSTSNGGNDGGTGTGTTGSGKTGTKPGKNTGTNPGTGGKGKGGTKTSPVAPSSAPAAPGGSANAPAVPGGSTNAPAAPGGSTNTPSHSTAGH